MAGSLVKKAPDLCIRKRGRRVTEFKKSSESLSLSLHDVEVVTTIGFEMDEDGESTGKMEHKIMLMGRGSIRGWATNDYAPPTQIYVVRKNGEMTPPFNWMYARIRHDGYRQPGYLYYLHEGMKFNDPLKYPHAGLELQIAKQVIQRIADVLSKHADHSLGLSCAAEVFNDGPWASRYFIEETSGDDYSRADLVDIRVSSRPQGIGRTWRDLFRNER